MSMNVNNSAHAAQERAISPRPIRKANPRATFEKELAQQILEVQKLLLVEVKKDKKIDNELKVVLLNLKKQAVKEYIFQAITASIEAALHANDNEVGIVKTPVFNRSDNEWANFRINTLHFRKLCEVNNDTPNFQVVGYRTHLLSLIVLTTILYFSKNSEDTPPEQFKNGASIPKEQLTYEALKNAEKHTGIEGFRNSFAIHVFSKKLLFESTANN